MARTVGFTKDALPRTINECVSVAGTRLVAVFNATKCIFEEKLSTHFTWPHLFESLKKTICLSHRVKCPEKGKKNVPHRGYTR